MTDFSNPFSIEYGPSDNRQRLHVHIVRWKGGGIAFAMDDPDEDNCLEILTIQREGESRADTGRRARELVAGWQLKLGPYTDLEIKG